MIGIYKITSPSKKIYIGQSINIKKRINKYKNLDCSHQKRLYNSILKYGWINHKFEILCECDTLELNDKERYYQDLYNTIEENGLNCMLTKSNDRSGKRKEFSEEAKKNMGNPKIGRKYNKEHCLKISEGKYKIIINIKTGKEFKGLKEASISVGFSESYLCAMLKGNKENKTNLSYKL